MTEALCFPGTSNALSRDSPKPELPVWNWHQTAPQLTRSPSLQPLYLGLRLKPAPSSSETSVLGSLAMVATKSASLPTESGNQGLKATTQGWSSRLSHAFLFMRGDGGLSARPSLEPAGSGQREVLGPRVSLGWKSSAVNNAGAS